jgi:anti-sigma factor RsiW
MTDHLSSAILNALADGELSAEQLASAQEHLAACPACTTSALHQTLLKSATARAGQRYAPPQHLLDRLARTKLAAVRPGLQNASRPSVFSRRYAAYGWATAAALLLVFFSIVVIQRHQSELATVSAERAALIAEVSDQHIATLASTQPLAVLSSDRHTVKPWFQGKLPFSFNLPDNLPADTRLEGANLTYVHNQPAAQLIYSIGKHRVSVFLKQKAGDSIDLTAESSGFHLMAASMDGLQLEAISDVDPSRLAELVSAVQHAQIGARPADR